jgi:hypothetical protein
LTAAGYLNSAIQLAMEPVLEADVDVGRSDEVPDTNKRESDLAAALLESAPTSNCVDSEDVESRMRDAAARDGTTASQWSDLSQSTPAPAEGRWYQRAIITLLSLLPLISLFHFWRLVCTAHVVTTGNPPKVVDSVWS